MRSNPLSAVIDSQGRTRRVGLVVVALVGLSSFGTMVAATARALGPYPAQRVNLDAYPEIRSRDLPERFRVWLEEEVVWIITEPERDIFLRLDSDEKRDRFIEAFWTRRDPTPGTPRNEYLPIHYERLAYATRQFGRVSPGPGWRTDMGRIYVLLGEPQTRSRHHNDANIYPVEAVVKADDIELGLHEGRNSGAWTVGVYATGVHGYERLQMANPDYLIPSVSYLPELIFTQIQSRLMRGEMPGEELAYDPTDADIRLGRRMRTEAITKY